MIPNFNTYNILKESISLRDLDGGNKRNLGYGDIKRGFLSKGYEFLGNISFKVKTINCVSYDEIMSVVPTELCDKLKKCGKKYITHIPDKRYVDMSLFGMDNGIDKSLETISNATGLEKVQSCFSKKGDLYYVLWNEKDKYFYFLTVDKYGYYSNNSAIGFLELYIKIRTAGLDVVTQEVDELYDEYSEKQRGEEEEKRIKKEKEEEERRIKKEKEEAYQKRVDAIKADVEENPENYESIKQSDLPEEIKKELDSDDYMDSKYVKYVSHGKWDPYDNEQIIVYINDDDLTKGYKYESSISHAKSGTYWGD